MAYLNKTILMGNLGCNPDVGYFADNTPRCRFTLATKKTWKEQSRENYLACSCVYWRYCYSLYRAVYWHR